MFHLASLRRIGIFLVLVSTLLGSAFATPISGHGASVGFSHQTNLAAVYGSSLNSLKNQTHSSSLLNNSFHPGLGGGVHQFVAIVPVTAPPPPPPQTPEPSTLTLFGSGLIALAGAVRRKFRN